MKKIKLKRVEIFYVQGTHQYNKGISGKFNYEHMYKNKKYNGCGGEHVFTSSKLYLYGITDNNKEIKLSIKNDILKTFNRNKLSDSFTSKLESNLPDIVTLEPDKSEQYHLSKESCRQIFRNIYPRKKYFD